MTQEISLSAVLLARAAAIMRLKAHKLPLDWVKEFSVGQLTACCDRMDAVLPDSNIPERTLQRELIQNPGFAAWFAKLLPMFPEEPPAEEKKPEPAYASNRYRSTPPASPPFIISHPDRKSNDFQPVSTGTRIVKPIIEKLENNGIRPRPSWKAAGRGRIFCLRFALNSAS